MFERARGEWIRDPRTDPPRRRAVPETRANDAETGARIIARADALGSHSPLHVYANPSYTKTRARTGARLTETRSAARLRGAHPNSPFASFRNFKNPSAFKTRVAAARRAAIFALGDDQTSLGDADRPIVFVAPFLDRFFRNQFSFTESRSKLDQVSFHCLS